MSTITVKDSTTIYYKDWGKGPVVTFSHGWPLSSDAYGFVERQSRDHYEWWTTPVHALRIGAVCNGMAWVDVEAEC